MWRVGILGFLPASISDDYGAHRSSTEVTIGFCSVEGQCAEFDGISQNGPASAGLPAPSAVGSRSDSSVAEIYNKFPVSVGARLVIDHASGVTIVARTARDGRVAVDVPVAVGRDGPAEENLE